MGLIECASEASVWRGYDYFNRNKVISVEKNEENIFAARVSGSASEPYTVELHIKHPRKSKCNCPHADGKRIICKHLVATYFTMFPEEAERYYVREMEYQAEEEKQEAELYNSVCQYVWRMKKSELQQTLLELLFDGPEWLFDRFVRENGINEDRL